MAALRGLGAMGNLEGLGHTDRYDIQFCRLITKNYSNSFSVLMGVWGFFNSCPLKTGWSCTKSLHLARRGPCRPLDTHGYLGGGGVVSSNEAGHLEVISVCVGALEVLGALGA